MSAAYVGEDGSLLASIQLRPVDKINFSQQLEDRPYSQFVNQPISNEGKIDLAQATGMRYQKSSNGTVTLLQKDDSSRQVDVMLQNLQNMGYEGTFWFGNPS